MVFVVFVVCDFCLAQCSSSVYRSAKQHSYTPFAAAPISHTALGISADGRRTTRNALRAGLVTRRSSGTCITKVCLFCVALTLSLPHSRREFVVLFFAQYMHLFNVFFVCSASCVVQRATLLRPTCTCCPSSAPSPTPNSATCPFLERRVLRSVSSTIPRMVLQLATLSQR